MAVLGVEAQEPGPVSLGASRGGLCIIQETKTSRKKLFSLVKSDGSGKLFKSPFFILRNSQPEDLEKCFDLHFSRAKGKKYLFYRLKNGTKSVTFLARSKDLSSWETISQLPERLGAATLIPETKFLYVGGRNIKLGSCKVYNSWKIREEPVLSPRRNFFDANNLEAGAAFLGEQGVLLFYYNRKDLDHEHSYSVGAAMFDKKDPGKLLWRLEHPLWEQPPEWLRQGLRPLGIIQLGDEIQMYWGNAKGETFVAKSAEWSRLAYNLALPKKVHLKRHHKNPVLGPDPSHVWKSKAAFNPAAVYLGGKVHLVYRAVGDSDISVLGYAASKDGLHFDEVLKEPAYVPREEFEGANTPKTGEPSDMFESGGGCWGGCEDPRLTPIGDRLYLTYVAYDGRHGPRVALSSIAEADFLSRQWRWSKPVLISRPGEINKNACILPEKINGKYVIFHRVYPDILIDYVDDLNFDGKTKWLETKAKIKPRKAFWDSRKVGVGPPPIKTDKGWLVIYQGVGEQESNKYKIGAMLLDLHNPEKVLARTKLPVLQPDEPYENHGWKFGVVYPCGAVVVDGKLLVYYGGADTNVCTAVADLNEFVNQMLEEKQPEIKDINSFLVDKAKTYAAR